MSEFQLTQVALVGARIEEFHSLGFLARRELAMCSVVPTLPGNSLSELPTTQFKTVLKEQLPIWVHNAIVDPHFPLRDKLSLPLRRFEGEIRDHREDEVVTAVLSAGFRDRQLNPLDLPVNMPMRQRCTLVMQISTWQEMYQNLEEEFVEILADYASELDDWLALVSEADTAETE